MAVNGDADSALIGAPGHNLSAGAAYSFMPSGSKWRQRAEVRGTDSAGGDEFGSAVALDGNGETALVGAPFHNLNAGAAYVFNSNGAKWTQRAEFAGADTAGGDQFGISLALSDDADIAIVGAPDRNLAIGAAYVFVRLEQ